ncbi:phosphorylase superfamily protein [Penicillium brevicompactum]|uniref:phosphorylase superfamily protein n=1 Tax=Penicillium brevicompactum TaxID=5074 RepID=UPI0025422581|nr:phosphorylase superfamily protein [Penicillium brevicompactum]KAJ5346750.1 phosphorylase superfamily protein [Penicillium brevicompactum]
MHPSCREDFRIAIICALPIEYDAISLVFDQFWDGSGDKFGKLPEDPNNYTTGRIGNHNVVLAMLSHIGKASAASVIASICRSYVNIRLAIVTGICGGVPLGGRDGSQEMLLGDVVISNIVVQHDFGKRYPDRFHRKDTIQSDLNKPSKELRSLLLAVTTETGLERLQQRTNDFLQELQATAVRKNRRTQYTYPGKAEDRPFEADYRHMHHNSPSCICREWSINSDPVCVDAPFLTCDDLGCEKAHLIPRKRLQSSEPGIKGPPMPAIHFGPIASGDTVMKSGVERDIIAKREEVIAFEMESAGIWEEVPSIVVKGVCDYSDCHKNKNWQTFAAATAASAVKAVLERYSPREKAPPNHKSPQKPTIAPTVRQDGSRFVSHVEGKEIKQGNQMKISSQESRNYAQGGSFFGGSTKSESSVTQGNTMTF